MIGEGGSLCDFGGGEVPEGIVLPVEPEEGSVRAVEVDGLVGQLSVNPADEFEELGVPGEFFLLLLEGLLFEVGVLTEVARPILVRVIDPVLRPCDASGSNLTDPKVVVVGIGGFDRFDQSQVPGIAFALRVHHDCVFAPSVGAAWLAVRTAGEVLGADRAGLLESSSVFEGGSPREIAEYRQCRCICRRGDRSGAYVTSRGTIRAGDAVFVGVVGVARPPLPHSLA